jgi:NADPH2 dehydrogenase
MGMADPLPTFSYVISQLAVRHPTLAYLHLVEPRISGGGTRDLETIKKHESNNALAAVWALRALVRTGGFTREGAIEVAEGGEKVLVGFGRWFLSNVRVLF